MPLVIEVFSTTVISLIESIGVGRWECGWVGGRVGGWWGRGGAVGRIKQALKHKWQ